MHFELAKVLKGTCDDGVQWIFSGIISAVGMTVLMTNLTTAIKVCVAPRVVIIEQFAQWLK